jgi:hypothetical protein
VSKVDEDVQGLALEPHIRSAGRAISSLDPTSTATPETEVYPGSSDHHAPSFTVKRNCALRFVTANPKCPRSTLSGRTFLLQRAHVTPIRRSYASFLIAERI